MEYQIITCISCGARLRIPSDRHIRFNCPACGKEFFAMNGIVLGTGHEPGKQEPRAVSSAKRYKKPLLRIGIVAGILLLIVFFVRFWRDYSDYRKLVEENNIRYYYSYIKDHPNGLYKARAIVIKNKMWDKMIAHYDSLSVSGERDEKAVAFFKNMLLFMKENDVVDVFVKFESTTRLTNFSDFADSTRKACRAYYRNKYPHIHRYNAPDDSNTIEIRSHFTQGALDKLQDIVFSGLGRTFKTVFGSDFINLRLMDDGGSNASVIIHIKYLISDAYLRGNDKYIPRILPYTDHDVFINNVPGVSIDFAGSGIEIMPLNQMFEFGSKQDFEHKNFQVLDLEDAYGQLTRSCFKTFVENFSTQFGLINYQRFDERALGIVEELLTLYGVLDELENEYRTYGVAFDRDQYSNTFLEDIRNTQEWFVNPSKIEEDSLFLEDALKNSIKKN